MTHARLNERHCLRRWLGWTVLAWAALAVGPSAAQQDALQTRFAIDDADPESHVPTPEQAMRAPLQMGYWTMLVAERAEAAMKKGEHASAIRYYRALANAVPDRSISHTSLCKAYEAQGDWANAVASCKAALGKAGVKLDDHTRFVRVLLARPGTLGARDVADADAVIAHIEQALRSAGAGADAQGATPARVSRSAALLPHQLRCELALRLEDGKRLGTCSAALQKLAPGDARTVTFQWALALTKKDFAEAQRLVTSARRAKLPDDALAAMEKRLELERERAPWWQRLLDGGKLLATGTMLLVLLAGAALLLAWRRSGRRRRTFAQPA